MEFEKLVESRRSCRAYQKMPPIAKEEIESILKDVPFAPSWKNTETGRYYVAYTPEMVKKVYDALPEFNKKSTENAVAFLVTTFVKDVSGFAPDGSRVTKVGNEWGAYDLGCQASYLLLSARNHGYDTLIMGLADVDGLKELFSIPEEEIIMPVIALGVRSKEPELRPRKEVDEICKYY